MRADLLTNFFDEDGAGQRLESCFLAWAADHCISRTTPETPSRRFFRASVSGYMRVRTADDLHPGRVPPRGTLRHPLAPSEPGVIDPDRVGADGMGDLLDEMVQEEMNRANLNALSEALESLPALDQRI